ncbi:MAG: FkbM family methyltransferase [Pseudomonadota bacterium]
MISYTENREDVLLERCFKDVAAGFYIDIGAHHPTFASVTRLFYDRGWSGINVEPGEGIAALRADRPRDINLEVAVADQEGETTFWVHTANTGTSSLSQSVPDLVAEKAGEMRPVKVAVTTLPAIIDQHAAGRHIHFLKIDAEGAEDAIVRAADWSRHRPEVVVIESTEPYTTIRRTEEWQKRLAESSYTLAYFDGINDFWVRNESAHLLEHFKLPVNVLDGYTPYNHEVIQLRRQVGELISALTAARAGGSVGALKSLVRPLVHRARAVVRRVQSGSRRGR